jgi:hypothetical protein
MEIKGQYETVLQALMESDQSIVSRVLEIMQEKNIQVWLRRQ